MYLKQLINSRQEYWEYVLPFIEWSMDPNRSLWREEDLPKLKPFFDNQNNLVVSKESNPWTQEIKDSFDFYKECCAAYGDKNKEMRDAVSKLSDGDILEAFGFEIPECNDDEDENYTLSNPPPLAEDFDATFPFVVIGDMHCGWDRSGDITILSVYRVSLKDFV